MGAWNYYSFDNDAAADFAEDFLENPSEAILYEALATAAEEEGALETDEASQALAAAEIVAAILGKPAQDLPTGLIPVIVRLEADGDELRELAEAAVTAVLNNSALQEHWSASADYGRWQGLQRDLLARLQDDTDA